MTEIPAHQRREFVTLLQRGKKHLWDGTPDRGDGPPKFRYICYAVTHFPFYNPTAAALAKVIEERLRPSRALEGWLVARGVPYKDMTNERMQAHRLAWIDKLIEEFSQ